VTHPLRAKIRFRSAFAGIGYFCRDIRQMFLPLSEAKQNLDKITAKLTEIAEKGSADAA